MLFAAIASFCDGGALELFCETDGRLYRTTTVPLDRGDVLVFRGDTVHAGAASDEGHNGRLHVYLDNPHVQRQHNRTHVDVPELVEVSSPSKRTRTLK